MLKDQTYINLSINLHLMHSHSSSNIVSLSQLQNAERQRIYGQHIKKMTEIDSQRKSAKIKEEQTRIAEVLRKSKEVSKSFKKIQQQNKRKQEDRKMVETLIDIKRKPRMKTMWQRAQSQKILIQSKSLSKEKQFAQEDIRKQNKLLAMSIVQNSLNVRKYKKKLKSEIDQYLKIRNNMQKIKTVETERSISKQMLKQPKPDTKHRMRTQDIQSNPSKVEITFPQTTSKDSSR